MQVDSAEVVDQEGGELGVVTQFSGCLIILGMWSVEYNRVYWDMRDET